MKNIPLTSLTLIFALSLQSSAYCMEKSSHNEYKCYLDEYNNVKNSYLKEKNMTPLEELRLNEEANTLINLAFNVSQQDVFTAQPMGTKKNGYEIVSRKDLNGLGQYYQDRFYNSLTFFEQKGYFTTKHIALEANLDQNKKLFSTYSGIAAERTEIRTGRVVGAFGLAALIGLGSYWLAKK